MTQSRRASLTESLANAIAGYAISVALAVLLFGVTWAQAVTFSPVYVIASVIRSYAIRRLFSR